MEIMKELKDYPLMICGIVLIFSALGSPVWGINIIDSMRIDAEVIGCILIGVSLIRHWKKK